MVCNGRGWGEFLWLSVAWSVVSFVALLAGVGALTWYFAVKRHEEQQHSDFPKTDPRWG